MAVSKKVLTDISLLDSKERARKSATPTTKQLLQDLQLQKQKEQSKTPVALPASKVGSVPDVSGQNPFIGPVKAELKPIQELPVIKKPSLAERADSFIKSSSFLSDVGSGLDYLLVDLPAKKVQEGTALPIHELLNIINTKSGVVDPETGKRRTSTADYMKEQEAAAQEKLMQGLTPAQKELTGLALSGADMLLGMGMSGVAGVPYAAYQAVVGGANAGQKALDEGYSADKSAQLAAASGLASYGIEKMGGIAGDWGSKILQKAAGTKAGSAVLNALPEKALQYLSGLSDSKLSKIFGDSLSEGLEEGTEYNTQRILENLILDKDTPFDIKEAARSVAAGMVFGGVGSALGATGNDADISEKPDTGNNETVQSFFDVGDKVKAPAVINRVQEEINARRQAAIEGQAPEIRQSGRSREYQGRQERAFRNRVKDIFSVPNTVALRQEFDADIDAAAEEIKQNGKVSRETAEALFQKAYDNGRVVLDEYYNQYKPLKDQIRNTKLSISPEDAKNISDFQFFRKQNFGTLKIGEDGLPVDTAYSQLREQYPELFPADITHPADQLQKISEVAKSIKKTEQALDEYYGEEADLFLDSAREDFENALGEFAAEMQRVASVDREDALSLQRRFSQNPDGLTDQQIEELGHELNREKRKVEQVEKQNLLARGEKQVVRDFLRDGRTDFENINPVMNRKGIESVVEASRRAYEIEQILGNRRSKIREEKRIVTEGLLTNSDLWQDKATGVQYSRETAERNLRDVMKADPEGYRKIKAAIFDPIHKNEAAKQKFMNAYRERVKEIGLNSAESRYVQLLGENQIDELKIPARDGLQKIDRQKVKQAVEEFRKIYAELYDQVNEVLVRNGYEPIEPIEGYFPHFQEEVTWLHPIKRVKQLVEDSKLPTDIAGLTHTFTPGKRWSGHLQHRDGIRTDYNAVKGLDQYLDSVADVIYHTDDIQNLRALESSIRRKYSDEATEATVDAATKAMSVEQAEQVEDALYSKLLKDKDNAGLGNFVTWLRRYTDILAGKKALIDREIEHETGRAIYKLVGEWEGQIAKNMVSTNLSSAFSNFIPIVQATGEVKNKYLLQAMADTVKSGFKSDGFAENSTFITNRKGSDKAFKTAGQKVSDVLSIPFQAVDTFTTNVVTRGKYLQLLEEGVDPETAMERADEFAASLMADRSVGALPTAFSTKNPFFKLFTMFQTEVNNQFSYLFKDLPKNVKEEGERSFAGALMRVAIYTFLAGLGYEELTGRDPQFNPLGMIFDFVMDATDEEKGIAEAALNFGKGVAEQTPFVGGLIGGGRFPIDAGLIPFEDVYNSTAKTIKREQSLEKWGDDLLNDVAKPLSMNLFPFGANQAWKSYQGIDTVAKGGLYGVQSDGGEQLKYPVEQTPGNYIKGALFGKSAFPEASAYYDSFKPVTDLDASGTRIGKLKSRLSEDVFDMFLPKSKKTADTKTAAGERDIVREAEKASLASVITFTKKDANGETVLDEAGNPVKEKVRLSKEEKAKYQAAYEAFLPEDMTGIPEEIRGKIFNFAEDAAAKEVLGEGYNPGSGVEKALEAYDNGIDLAQYFTLQKDFNGFETVKKDGREITASEQKREALFNNDTLTNEQKSVIDKLLIQSGDDKKNINYTNRDTLAYSLMTEKQQQRYDGVSAVFGKSITTTEYQQLKSVVDGIEADKDDWGDSVSGSKKAKTIAALQEEGLSLGEAHEMYALLTGNVPSDAASKDEALIATLDDNGKARFSAVQGYFSSITPTQYLVYSDAISDANASSFAEKLEALVNLGFSEKQAAVFIGCSEVSKKTDLSDPGKALYQIFTDSQKEKYAAVKASKQFAKMQEYDFYYFYKIMGSGKKAEKIARLKKAGLSEGLANAFYKLVS